MMKLHSLANAIIYHNRTISYSRLRNLVFLTYGWHSAIKNTFLFDENIIAMKYGVEIPILKEHFSKNEVSYMITHLPKPEIHMNDDNFIEDVVNNYKGLTDIQLMNYIHDSSLPWYKFKSFFKDDEYEYRIISPDLIKACFQQLLNIMY